MRVAICIWGLLRSLKHTVTSFEKHIIAVLDRFEVSYDIYVHTYNISGSYQSARNHEKSVTLNVSEWQLLKPNYIFVENQEDFDSRINYVLFETQGDPWHNDFSSFRNHMRALNSLYHVTQAVESMHQKEPYDAVVFLRPDVRFITDLPIQLLYNPQIMSAYDMFLPDFHRSCQGNEYNDRMALGKVFSALSYGKKFETAFVYSLSHKLHAEKITFYQLSRAQKFNGSVTPPTRVAEIPFRFQRIRSSGGIHIRDYEAVTPQEQAKLEKRGEYFVGKGRRTPWIVRAIYTLAEYMTFGQVYIWNHDDHGNVFCHPHPHLNYKILQQLSHQHLSQTKNPLSSVPQKRTASTRERRIDCSYQVVPYTFTQNYSPISAKYIRVESCRFVSLDEKFSGPSTLSKHHSHHSKGQEGSPANRDIEPLESQQHMPKKNYHSMSVNSNHHHNLSQHHSNNHTGHNRPHNSGEAGHSHLRSSQNHETKRFRRNVAALDGAHEPV